MSGGRKHRRHVTPEEAKLWRAVTRQFVPFGSSRDVLEPEAGTDEAAPGSPEISSQILTPKSKSQVPTVKAPVSREAPLAEFDHRRARRLSSGRLPIDAKLDLHGLRQGEARGDLLRFLQRAQDSGFRHVKVITGKGATGRDDEATKPFSLFDPARRGVLREQVPRWLGEPDFRRLVVSFTVAGRGHGGGGALYVQLRKKAVR
jgi:DNA-nicking Smr family endonuclease